MGMKKYTPKTKEQKGKEREQRKEKKVLFIHNAFMRR